MFFSKSFKDFLVFVSLASFDIFLFEWRSVHYADRPPQDLLPSALLELNYTNVLQLQKLPVLDFVHIDYTVPLSITKYHDILPSCIPLPSVVEVGVVGIDDA